MKLVASILFLNVITQGLLSILVISSCNDQKKCPIYVQIPAQIIPQKAEYHLGDTIKIISKFHHDILAYDSEEKEIGNFNMTNVEWKPLTVISRIDTLGQAGTSKIHLYFSFVENINYDYKLILISDDFSALEGEYNYKEDSFDLQIKLIPKKIGSYFLRQESTTFDYGDQDFPGKCPYENVDARVKMNNYDDLNDNNINLLSESPDTHFNTWILTDPKTNFFNFGGYCFKVVP